MKTQKAAKRGRREHRKDKDRRRRRADTTTRGQPFGEALPPDTIARLAEALKSFDPGAPWSAMAPMILPVLKRAWHPFPSDVEPLLIQVPPGIPTGFGIDIGPGFSHVTKDLLERWGVDQATLLGTALENLRALTRVEPPIVERLAHDGVSMLFVQGQGWGSALVLLPDLLRPILGSEPAILLAPVRNTLVRLPATVDPRFVFDVWSALADGAHDALDLDPLRWTGTAVVAYADAETRGLPN